jgi:REP element-mobilizing transposase RayT
MRIPIQTGEYYHVYNRGTDKRDIFLSSEDLERFKESIKEFNTTRPIGSIYQNNFRKKNNLSAPSTNYEPIVEIITYSLLPNHYHLTLRQIADEGISKFIQKLGSGYTRFFNEKYERNGVLFQGKYKIKHIETNEYLLTISAYHNLNGDIHGLSTPSTNTELYQSSFVEYMGTVPEKERICKTGVILLQFKSIQAYREYCKKTVEYIIKKRQKNEDPDNPFLDT